MSGMVVKMKTIIMTKTRATLILSHQGTVINNLEVAEGTTRLEREHQDNLISNSMDTSPMQRGQLQIPRQKKSHPNMRTILIFIGLFKHH